ncbi:asparaginase [Streptococcus iniae]
MQADRTGQVAPNAINPMTELQITLITSNFMLSIFSTYQVLISHLITCLNSTTKSKRTAAYDGIVITHGTDTLEETAYFLDTMAIPDVPLVITGAMRSANEIGSDGIYNYLTALRVASHDKSKGKGVLVVMNDEIHAGKYVTKTHTTNISTFQTPTHGPLGIVTKDDLLFFKTAEPRVRFDLKELSGTIPIVKAYAGMGDGSILSILSPDNIQGLVIEALGAGNIHH